MVSLDMNCRRYLLGSHTLEVRGDSSIQLLDLLPGFSLFLLGANNKHFLHSAGNDVSEASTGSSFLVELDVDVSLPSLKVLHEFPFDNGSVICKFAKNDSIYYVTMEPEDGQGSLFVMEYCGGTVIRASSTDNPSILRFALWMAYAMMVAPIGVTLIHSSVVATPRGAVMVLGESGTGKSTHTRLWLNNIPDTYLLNDDSPIVACESDGVFVYGSPWSGKTPCYRQCRVPVLAFVRLSQAPFNRIERLSGLQAFIALQPSCPPALAFDGHFTDHIVDLVSGLIRSVPVFHLSCLPDAEAAHLCFDAVMKGVGG